MQEFWATAMVHHHFIRFKMDNKKHIVNLEYFKEMLHIYPRLPVEHKDAKKSNEMYYPWFTKVIIHYFMSKDPSIPKRNKVNWHYVRDDQMFTTIKLECYAVATGTIPPKTKESVRKMKSSSDTTVTPPPTAATGTRLSTSAKDEGTGIIPGVPDVPTEESDEEISWISNDEQDDDYVDEGSDNQDDDDAQDDNDDDQDSDKEGEEFIHPGLSIHDAEETKDEESFDPITKMPENTDNKGNDEENLGLNVGRKEGQDEENDEDELYRDVNINLEGRVVQMDDSDRPCDEAQAENEEFLKNLDENIQKIIKEQVKEQVKVQVSKILPKIEQTVNEKLEAKVLTWSSNSSKTSYAVAADLLEIELKKILIKKMEGDKSIHRSNKQGNLYKALVEAYESNKIILDTYRNTVTLKRRHDDDVDKDEEPSAGSDWGSKRRREGKEPESANAPKEKATRTTGKSTQTSKSRQTSTSESTITEEPMESARNVYSKRRIITVTKLKIVEWHNYKHLDWITVRRDDDKLYKFKEDDFKRLRIQDIEDMLLLLVQGKLTNLMVEERFAFNVSLRMFTRSIVIQRIYGRPSTRCRKLPEEAQPHKAGYIPFRSKAQGSLHRILQSKRIHLS
nr:hypothetical protein [Tanacetum cinerariifolium]